MDIPLQSLEVSPAQAIGKTFGPRAGAYVIDMIAFYAVSYIVAFGVGFGIALVFMLTGRELPTFDQSQKILSQIASLILFVVYFTVFEWLYGATLGKLILGMRVVKENGDPCNLGAALVRALLRFIDGFFFAIPAAITMKAPLYQRFGDKSAGTIVVGAKDTVIQRPRTWTSFLAATGLYLAVHSVVILAVLITLIR